MQNLGDLKIAIDALLAASPELSEAPVTFLLGALTGGLEAGQGVGYEMVNGIGVKDHRGMTVVTLH